MSRRLKPLFGAVWERAPGTDFMTDELGHRRHIHKVPCFLGGTWHILMRDMGLDVRHCRTMFIRVCCYCGHEISARPKPDLVLGQPRAEVEAWARYMTGKGEKP